ncbi:MAG: ATP-binding protein [Lachnospiraceae bacterium]|nr:ATP-binding protein [Lachnospiraceae bacterium]MBR5765593.1 ATP-binding protein [Lachnospiraceae bacterium]MBR6485842.1 ATP-binding protein [Lachnospiraceae bacterium]
MAFKRNTELKTLQNYYNREDNQIVVLYGDRYSGRETLIKDFLKGKDHFYYLSRSCSECEQLKLWMDELRDDLPKGVEPGEGYSGIISTILSRPSEEGKRVIVVDEFQNIIKSGNEFMEVVVRGAHNKLGDQPVMFILSSSSVYWIENLMVEKLKELAFEISGLIRLNDLKFLDFTRNFKNYELESSVEAYSIIGGSPMLWEMWDDTKSVADNVCSLVLKDGAPLNEYGKHILPSELREPPVYNTILTALAQGKNKLNDIYKYTGFSRAKISVYIKNLIELEIVEKIDSVNTAGHENVQKGIYRITDPYVRFWFKYIFRNYSKLLLIPPEKFYSRYITPTFKSYTSYCFTDVCAEYLDILNHMDKLSFRYNQRGVWVGKVGTIDTVATDDQGRTLVALCNWENPVMNYADYEWLMFCVKQAKLDVNDIYLFSAGDFDLELKQEAMINENIRLIDGSQL